MSLFLDIFLLLISSSIILYYFLLQHIRKGWRYWVPQCFAQGHLPRGRGEEKDHIRKVSSGYLDHSFERFHRTQTQRGHAKVNGNFGKVTAKDLDDDLERYHLEALSGLKSKMESEITTDSFNDSF